MRSVPLAVAEYTTLWAVVSLTVNVVTPLAAVSAPAAGAGEIDDEVAP